jgi:hypothetical protein
MLTNVLTFILCEKKVYKTRRAINHSLKGRSTKGKGSCKRQLTKITLIEGKKAVPLQAWSGPEGSRKLRFPDFTTTAQDGGKVVSLKHRPPLPPGNTPDTHFC